MHRSKAKGHRSLQS